MIRGIGTDIVQISRIKFEISARILSQEETEIFAQFSSESRKREYLAGRFAAKEAIIKAFTASGICFGFKEMTILNDDLGKPYLSMPVIHGLKAWISISHEKAYAIAFCVVEDEKAEDSRAK